LVILLQDATADDIVKVFIRQLPLAAVLSTFPDFEDVLFETANGFPFGDAGIGHAV
jgi:hypothetical protein